ncbi:MAG: N-acetylmuramoyl-L-alanine amidase [Sporomusaceae bacterium]|nr:N-acetylmuramoyl-L-alanine amidase [Sporomusaceae bacterium]
MRLFVDGQQLPLMVKVSRDLLTTIKALSRQLGWGVFYDPLKEVIYINSKSQAIPAPTAERPATLATEVPESIRLLGKKICLDPGHGGKDPGAVGPTGTFEKNNTLAIALALRDKLENNGAQVLLTRDGDHFATVTAETTVEELRSRVSIANDNQADLFLSIHNDAFTSKEASGTTTYYYSKGDSSRLAQCLQKKLVDRLGTKDRNARFGSFYVIRYASMPAALVEVGFISNPEEEVLLASADGRVSAAEALFEGIMQYFKV